MSTRTPGVPSAQGRPSRARASTAARTAAVTATVVGAALLALTVWLLAPVVPWYTWPGLLAVLVLVGITTELLLAVTTRAEHRRP